MTTRIDYATSVLHAGGWPAELGAVQGLIAVMVGESSEALWNPTDTTLPEPGATPYNTFDGNLHVWNYPSLEVGVAATVATIRGLPALAAALTGGPSAEETVAAFDTSWAGQTISLYAEVLPGVLHSWPNAGIVAVAGSPAPPPLLQSKGPPILLLFLCTDQPENTSSAQLVGDYRRGLLPGEAAFWNEFLAPHGLVKQGDYWKSVVSLIPELK